MKEMTHSRHHHHRKELGAGPVEHVGQGHRVIALAVDHQGLGMRLARNRRHRKPAGGGTDQHQAVDLTLLLQRGQSVCGDKGAERKTR